MHSTHAHRLPPGTSENHWKSLCFCMPPPKEDVTNTIKMLLIQRNPYKRSKIERFRSVALHQSVASAQWIVASPLDPTRGPFKKWSYKLWLDFSRFHCTRIPLQASMFKMLTLSIPSKPYQFRETLINVVKMKDSAWLLEVPDNMGAGQGTHTSAVRAASRHAA